MKKVKFGMLAVLCTVLLAGMGMGGERVKVGVAFFDFAMPLGVDIKNMIDYAAKALDCDVEYAANNFDTEKVVTDIENLFASGCKAVIVCNSADGQMPKAVRIAERYNGKVFQFFRTISDESIKNAVWASPGYGGQVHEDEYKVGYALGTAMYEAGCRNVGLINFNHGDLTAEQRQAGYVDAFKKLGVNIVAETWDISTGEESARVTENYVAAYPEMDGVALVGGSGEALFGVQSALKRHGKTGSVKLSTTDFYDAMEADLESGALGMISGGHWCDPFFSFMLAYNWAAGSFADGDLPVEVPMDMIYITSPEDARLFAQWFKGEEPPYNAEEIRNLTKTYNPDFKLSDLVKAATSLSLQDVIQRRGK